MAFVLKTTLDSDMHRVLIDPVAGFKYADLRGLLQEQFPKIAAAWPLAFITHFEDDEKDLIRITTDRELAEAFRVAEMMGCKSLKILISNPKGDGLVADRPRIQPKARMQQKPRSWRRGDRRSVVNSKKYHVKFVKDVTVVDGNVIAPSTTFTKTWAVQNSGSTSWPEETALVCVGGNKSPLAARVLVGKVKPGTIKEISVDITTPSTVGRFRSDWRFVAKDNKSNTVRSFGATKLWVDVTVKPVAIKAAPITGTGLKASAAPEAKLLEKTKDRTKKYFAKFVKDVTIPDGSVMIPGITFTKTWAVENSGKEKWPVDTALVCIGPVSSCLLGHCVMVGAVKPKEMRHISVDMVTPSKAGSFKNDWRLVWGKNAKQAAIAKQQTERFAIKLWADVIVADATAITGGAAAATKVEERDDSTVASTLPKAAVAVAVPMLGVQLSAAAEPAFEVGDLKKWKVAVDALLAMGFTPTQFKELLRSKNGNINEIALELLR